MEKNAKCKDLVACLHSLSKQRRRARSNNLNFGKQIDVFVVFSLQFIIFKLICNNCMYLCLSASGIKKIICILNLVLMPRLLLHMPTCVRQYLSNLNHVSVASRNMSFKLHCYLVKQYFYIYLIHYFGCFTCHTH